MLFKNLALHFFIKVYHELCMNEMCTRIFFLQSLHTEGCALRTLVQEHVMIINRLKTLSARGHLNSQNSHKIHQILQNVYKNLRL